MCLIPECYIYIYFNLPKTTENPASSRWKYIQLSKPDFRADLPEFSKMKNISVAKIVKLELEASD